jgi:ATP-dependent protease Clp ATPase subunit
MEINAAQLTKEGTAGNSLSKALSPLSQKSGKQTIVFVDEFDKLFISGNHNSDVAHETTNGVQNEFLKVLESDEASVYGDYGKYVMVSLKHVLFVFAGAFNGEEDVTLDRLRDFGVKTEFLGRVGLVYNALPLSLEDLITILNNTKLLKTYLKLFQDVKREDVIGVVGNHMERNYTTNPIGARAVNTLIHQYFIKGGKLEEKVIEKTAFQHKMPL